MRERQARPNWATLMMLGVSIVLFGAVAWTHLSGARGGWRPALEGRGVGELPAMAVSGHEVQIQHPALVYFFQTDCSPCAPVVGRLNQFASTRRPGGLPIYALTNSIHFTADSARVFSPEIHPVRLRNTTQELNFLQELPMLVRTDAAGLIKAAFVGVPSPEDLLALGYPWEASPTRRP